MFDQRKFIGDQINIFGKYKCKGKDFALMCFKQFFVNEDIRDWILLDSESSSTIFCNKQYVKNIQSNNKFKRFDLALKNLDEKYID